MYSENGTLRLMCILAHPDDESFGTGGTLARYAAEGIETYVITATRGQRGWFGPPEENPGLAALGQIREAELRAAAQALGVKELVLLDYVDGDLDRAEKADAIRQLVAHLRRIRPHVVVTFDPFGVYGHPTISPSASSPPRRFSARPTAIIRTHRAQSRTASPSCTTWPPRRTRSRSTPASSATWSW